MKTIWVTDKYSCRPGVNSMWILKNFKELLSNLEHLLPNNISSIRTFHFSTLYTTIPHSKLKERLRSLVMRAFFSKKGERRYKYLVVNYTESYFVKNNLTAKRNRNYPNDQLSCWQHIRRVWW